MSATAVSVSVSVPASVEPYTGGERDQRVDYSCWPWRSCATGTNTMSTSAARRRKIHGCLVILILAALAPVAGAASDLVNSDVLRGSGIDSRGALPTLTRDPIYLAVF